MSIKLGAGLFTGTSLLLKGCGGNEASQTGNGGRLVAATFTGSWKEAHRTILVPYFAQKTGTTTNLVPQLAIDQVAQLTASANSPPYDVALLDAGPFRNAPVEEILQPFPVDLSENFQDLLPQYQTKADEWGPTELFKRSALVIIRQEFLHRLHHGKTCGNRSLPVVLGL
ncbi:hypothetical protein IQ230_13485 [Gloeocapsopsis crepidinum LEGE 06123]|uniref:Uncharacterized protein n=1 Tax=Gloeocapsopsis crepidinum LEGE 06123 TaxID=588587 RepID=A0ABR9UST5_9CHRO|nr:hypothetical protein [Gloeocapsopsis crepidinum]MBE9191347.1 hypothetical protein [Gloeocapsopsis crepidinum LEGE 06123]